MDEPYSKARALELIQVRRAALDACLTGLAADRLTEPGAVDGWSIKDVLAHVAWWERWLVRVLRGEQQATAELAQVRRDDGQQVVDRLNAATYVAHRDRPLPDVLAESRAAFDAAVGAVSGMDEDAFSRHRRVVAGNTFEHYEEHTRQLRDWLARENGGR